MSTSISNFVVKDNVFSGKFAFDGRTYSLDGIIVCYGLRHSNSAGNVYIYGTSVFNFETK